MEYSATACWCWLKISTAHSTTPVAFIGAALTFDRFTLTGQANLNGVARFDRLNKAQVFHPIVGDNRPDAGIDEQPGRGGDQK